MRYDVAIINYGLSNLHSVRNACKKEGLSAIITDDKKIILNSKAAILPGVGAFGEAKERLLHSGLDKCIIEFVSTQKIFIGICLGFQLLFSKSFEFGEFSGFNFIDGEVKKFELPEPNYKNYKIPQIGWNKIFEEKSWKNTLLTGIDSKDFMYFVHSYYVDTNDKDCIISSSEFAGIRYCTAIKKNNIYGFQFHPEKSGLKGLKIYKNLRELIG